MKLIKITRCLFVSRKHHTFLYGIMRNELVRVITLCFHTFMALYITCINKNNQLQSIALAKYRETLLLY